MTAIIGRQMPYILGALFLYSGTSKVLWPGEATYALVSLDLPLWLSKVLVVAVTVFELYLGSILTLKIDLKYALLCSSVLLVVFTIFMWYLSTLADPPACGCMGLTACGSVWALSKLCSTLGGQMVQRPLFGNT